MEEILRRGECETIEFKEKFGKETIETIVAMANSRGGYVLIGVQDDGEVLGVSIGNNTIVNWANEISQNTEPRIIPQIESIRYGEKNIVMIRVDEHPIKPVFFRGRAYIRVDASNRRMTQREITEMFESSTGTSWDYYIVDESLGILDEDAISKFAKMAKLDRYGKDEILRKLHLVREGKPTRAAVLLFGKNVQDIFMNAVVRVGRFKDSEILDSVDIEGNLFSQVENVMDAVKKHLNRKFIIRETKREEVWDYPLIALREGIINAIIHRDYRRPEEIQIKIYDDHLTIWNPGTLPFDLTVEDLYREHPSHPRNKLIAEVFYLAGYIEKWGSGTLRVISSFREYGLPEPKFRAVGEGFLLEFWKDILNDEYMRSLGLSDRQIEAVLYTKEKGKITNKEYQKLNKVSRPTASRDLIDLVSKGILKQIGTAGRGVYYIINVSEMHQMYHKRLKNDSKEVNK